MDDAELIYDPQERLERNKQRAELLAQVESELDRQAEANLAAVLETTAGKALLWRLIEASGVSPARAFHGENTHATSFALGERARAAWLLDLWMAASPHTYLEAHKAARLNRQKVHDRFQRQHELRTR